MRSMFRVLAILILGIAAGAALAEKIPNWAAPSTWKPPGAAATEKTGVKTGLVTYYPALPFIPVTPCRVADTRAGSGFPAGYGPPSMPGVHAQRSFILWGRCGIPGGALAVSFNFTVWAPVTRGDIRLFPAGDPVPNAATLNWEAGILALANAAVVPLSGAGAITVQVDGPGTIDLIIDVNGYYSQDVKNTLGGELFLTSTGSSTLYAGNSYSSGTSVLGLATGTGNSSGVYGEARGTGPAVYGKNTASGFGVEGIGNTGIGVYGTSTSSHAVKGYTAAATGNGVWAESTNWDALAAFGGINGVYASGAINGVTAISTASSGVAYGLYGKSSSSSNGSAGVHGTDSSGEPTGFDAFGPAGVVGASSNGSAGVLGIGVMLGPPGGRFVRLSSTSPYGVGSDALLAPSFGRAADLYGDVYVYANSVSGYPGNLSVAGHLSKGTGSFKIDHPLDPKNKYLYHSFVESPDMMNVYNGVTELGSDGSAVVKLPAYFEALNKDFRYQLTALGMSQPDLHVALEIANNEFVISGGKAYARVSWQVTGIRKDPLANARRIVPEVDKEPEAKGHYLHPDVYNKRGEAGTMEIVAEAMKAREAERASRSREE